MEFKPHHRFTETAHAITVLLAKSTRRGSAVRERSLVKNEFSFRNNDSIGNDTGYGQYDSRRIGLSRLSRNSCGISLNQREAMLVLRTANWLRRPLL